MIEKVLMKREERREREDSLEFRKEILLDLLLPTLMIVVLAAKVAMLRKAAREPMLRRALHQIVATHLCVMMSRRRSGRCAVGAGRMGRGMMVVGAIGHARRTTGRGARGGTVARHGANAEWTKAERCSSTAGGNPNANSGTGAIHRR